MGYSLFGLVSNYASISIIGMCKNAGKTTVLNNLISGHAADGPEGGVLALTSIGRDGESTDLVTGTEKPGIYIRAGSLFATAEKLLKYSDVTREILDTTGISTPLGEVAIVRALSDGNVQLAGPSIVAQLVEISRAFRGYGAGKVIIDGAVGRKSLCSKSLAEVTILCTGASLNLNMAETVAETAHVCSLLMTQEAPEFAKMISPVKGHGKFIILADEAKALGEGAGLVAEINSTPQPQGLYIGGALTDNMLAPLIRSGLPKGFIIAVEDASKLLIGADSMRRLTAAGCVLRVLNAINLAAIAINPFSTYGHHYVGEVFKQKMQSAVPVPVINVKD
ncbi:MAG: hypothetical protein FWB75_06625 [Oscillospiraceae bacterium]|nr:hypothetical protein [Oscillospiraceae bacterium]